jgi:serine/threonine protein kinase
MICPACGTENDDSADNCFKCGKGLYALTEGAVLASRYEILSLLGRGGMGIVYKAHDRSLDEMVALKVLRFDVARTGDVARRFRSEIKLARKVRHRNVCGIHEYGEDGPYRFIVMELIEGMDLRRILRERGAFPPREACSLAIEVTEGLQAIHEVGIVHRDLKSPNIMLDQHGRVRLMDFGIAKQFGADVTAGAATATGLVLGTPEYMSPEQARGQKIDFRSDIYALGVVAYELFTGHVPFKGETPLETIFKHLQETPVFAGPTAPGIPEPIVPVLRKALAKTPDERFSTAREMSRAFRQAWTEAFGASVESSPTPILTATAPDTHHLPRTQTLRTPTPVVAPTAVPTRVASGPPTEAPGRTVASGEAAAATRVSKPRPLPSRRGAVWAAAGAATAAVCVTGVLYLGGQRSAPQLAPNPSPEAPEAMSPAVAPTSAEPTPVTIPESTPTSKPAESRTRRVVDPASATPGKSATSSSARTRPPRAARPEAATARPTPTPRAAPATPKPTPTPAPPPPTPPPVPATGRLQLRILPWAEVTIDGSAVGTTPLRPVSLDEGEHRVVLSHPDYKPLIKSVMVHAGETTTLEVDLSYEAFPR